MFILYSVGIPLSGFYLLYKRRHNLEDWKTKRYFLMIYQGLKNKCFYWEFVNTIRKMLILIISIFLAQQSVYYKALSLVVLLIVFYRLQIYLEPYKFKMNNSIERLEMTTGLFTIFGGILFTDFEDKEVVFNSILFILILIANIYFILKWSFMMLHTFKDHHRAIDAIIVFLGFILRVKTDLYIQTTTGNSPKVKLTDSSRRQVKSKAKAVIKGKRALGKSKVMGKLQKSKTRKSRNKKKMGKAGKGGHGGKQGKEGDLEVYEMKRVDTHREEGGLHTKRVKFDEIEDNIEDVDCFNSVIADKEEIPKVFHFKKRITKDFPRGGEIDMIDRETFKKGKNRTSKNAPKFKETDNTTKQGVKEIMNVIFERSESHNDESDARLMDDDQPKRILPFISSISSKMIKHEDMSSDSKDFLDSSGIYKSMKAKLNIRSRRKSRSNS